MRCLILGGDGMLGHQLLQSWQQRHEVRVTVRRELDCYRPHGMFDAANTYDRVEAGDLQSLLPVFADFQPQAVINAIGVIKQRDQAKQRLPSLQVNSVFPHQLLELCAATGSRLVHVSTDCVFDGTAGNYRQNDPPTARDIYGLSKYLGEVSEAPAVTLRTSIIGLELSRKQSLVEWFLAQRGSIRGYRRAIYTGLTTLELSRVVESMFTEHEKLTGIWQVSSEPIDKYELLTRLARLLGRDDLDIEPDDDFFCDRSLCGDEFMERTGYRAPSWDSMLAELAAQITARGYCHAAA